MNFTTPSGQLIWSRNAGDLRLDTDGAGSVHFSVSCASRSFEFDLVPVGSCCRLRLDELLESLLPEPDVTLPDPVRITPATRVDITADDGETTVSWWCLAFRGGAAGNISGRFLSWKENPSPSWHGSAEPLSLLVESGSITFSAIAYLRLLAPVTLTLASVTVNAPSIVTIDASPDRISSLLDDAGISEARISAYDVTATDAESVRFLVNRRDARLVHFLFINSLGCLDTVHATGRRQRNLELVSESFSNRDVESELYNRSYGKLTVSSGYIQSSRALHQWREFLKASYRFLLQDEPKRIVVDDQSSEVRDFEASTISFTFHLAKEPRTWYYDNPELPPYAYPKTKLLG